ncbi:MAG: winged helix-turn-helix domain-containing protein [Acidobacteriota bacterium]
MLPTPGSPETFRFGDFELDVAAYELRGHGRPVQLERRPMDLLVLLVERRGQLVSRQDIVERLWGQDVFIEVEPGINTVVWKIRGALGDSSDHSTFVETVSGRGYRFVAPVEVVAQSSRQSSPTQATAPTRVPEPRRHNLPAEHTSFVGRRQELLELPGVLASSRLLSLTGAGGVGKTRLALRLSRDLVHEFSDGVWLVDLAPLSVPDLVAQTMATALGVREGPQRSARDALLDALRDRELLLVLDNCEHLIAACAELVEALLRAAPALRILATSREALGVAGETVYRVPSLSLPEALASVPVGALADSEATQLFVDRASAVDSAFTPTPNTADAIARICRRLDGIPFAIELAAARVVVLSPGQIEARLRDRFRLLTGGARTAVARQRTLEATVDWSYELLSEVERQFLSRLWVFPASWTLEAAEHVCGGDGIDEHDVLDLLSRLVGKSLVVVDGDVAGERRYRLLETVREYAYKRLVPASAANRLRERHFEFFFNEFKGVSPILTHHGQLPCLRRLRIEQENIRAVLEWALTTSGRADQGVELAGALFWFWTKCGLFEEGTRWLEKALATPAPVPRPLRARALIGVANLHWFQGRHVEAGTRAAEALALGRADGDAWVVSFALFLQGTAAFERGDHEQAEVRSREALDAADVSGEDVLHGPPLLVLANVAVSKGDYDTAQQLYDQSAEVLGRAGETWGLSIVLLSAAGLRVVREDYVQARVQASEALSLCQELDDPRGLAWSLEVFAGLLAAGGLADGASRVWGASERLLESVGGSLPPSIGWVRGRYIEPVRASLGGAFETARNEGRAMPVGQAIALVRQQALLRG